MDTMDNLKTLCIHSVQYESHTTELSLITSLIANNHMTLRQLDLGIEMDLIRIQPQVPRGTIAAKRIREGITAAFEVEKTIYFPNIDNLRLRGLDLNIMMSDEQHQLFNFASLKTLALESCSDINRALPRLTALSLPGLQTFHIRQEGCENNLLQKLEDFLCSLPPLTSISVLIIGKASGSFNIEKIMEVHAHSLQVLIMDLRDGRCVATVDSRSSWRKQYSLDVIELCPNLVELGIALDWEILNLGSSNCRLVRVVVRYYLLSVLLLTLFTVPRENKIMLAQAAYFEYPQPARH